MTISPIRGRAPAKRTITKFGIRGRVADVIICFKFCRNRLRGFRAVRGQKWGSSIDFDCRPYNRSALPCCLWLFCFMSLSDDTKFKYRLTEISSRLLFPFPVHHHHSRSRSHEFAFPRDSHGTHGNSRTMHTSINQSIKEFSTWLR